MADSFKWLLELVDKVSGPAKKATESTKGFEDELSKLEKQIAKVKADPGGFKSVQAAKREMAALKREAGGSGSGFGKLVEGVESIKNMEGIRLLGEGLHFAYEVGAKVAEVVTEIGEKFVEATGKEERYRISFKALLGDASEETQEYINHIAKAAELTDDELKGMSARLLTVGFNANELKQVLPASLDIAGFLGGGVEKAEAAAEALAHIKTTGEISKRSLGSLGLEWAKVLDQLHKETGLSVDEVKKKMDTGKFGPQVLHAVLQSIANKEGGALGNTAEKMGQTIEARLKRLKNLPDQFFQDLVGSNGFNAFSDFVGKLAKELSPDSPFGQEVMKDLNEIGDVIADALGIKGGDGIETVKNGIRGAISAAKDFIPVIVELAGDMADIAKSVADLLRDWNEFKGKPAVSDPNKVNEFSPDWKLKKNGVSRGMASVNENSPDWKLAQNGVVRNKDGSLNDSKDYYGPSEVPNASRWPAIPSQAPNVAANGGSKSITQSAKVDQHFYIEGGADADEIAQKAASAMPGGVQQSMERMAVATGAM